MDFYEVILNLILTLRRVYSILYIERNDVTMKFAFRTYKLGVGYTLVDAFRAYNLDVSFKDSNTIIINGKEYPYTIEYQTIWLNVIVEATYDEIYG